MPGESLRGRDVDVINRERRIPAREGHRKGRGHRVHGEGLLPGIVSFAQHRVTVLVHGLAVKVEHVRADGDGVRALLIGHRDVDAEPVVAQIGDRRGVGDGGIGGFDGDVIQPEAAGRIAGEVHRIAELNLERCQRGRGGRHVVPHVTGDNMVAVGRIAK